MSTTFLNQLVNVDAGFKPAVHLPEHFEDGETNAQLLKSYIPTTQTIELLADIARSLSQSSSKRARMLHGTYGTGKSDLLLVISNYFQRSVDDPVMQPLNDRLSNLNPHLFQTIKEQRQSRKPYLVVLLQADPTKPFPGFILHGLQQALDRIGMGELMGPTRYSAAVEKIETWRKNHHPILAMFTAELQHQAARDLDGLLAELKGSSPDPAFSVFRRVFQAATGTEFNIHEYSQPHTTYAQVARALHDRGTHEGILVVCDEFTWFLKRAELAITAGQGEIEHETLSVQDLANAAVASGRAQLHFIISSLEGFATAGLQTGSAEASRSIERVGGRFESFALGRLNSEELIRGALLRVPGSESIQQLPQRQRDALIPVAEALWKPQGKDREWIKKIILDGTFPLHPLATYALPLLNRNFAQSSRTMFLFLNDEQGLKGFLKRTPLVSVFPDWHNLLTLDLLFDYFVESIEVRRPEVIEAYDQARQMLSQTTVDKVEKDLAERLLKSLAICELSGDVNLSATRERLRVALNLPESAARDVEDALDILDNMNAIIAPPDPVGGVYGLAVGGRVMPNRLKRLIAEKAKTILQDSSQLVNLLQNQRPPVSVEAAEYNRERGTQRRLNARYIAGADLQRTAQIQRDIDVAAARGDGVLYYVVASSESERQEALLSARELTRKQQRVVVAVPQQATEVLAALRNYEALRHVRTDSTVQSGEQAYLLDNGRIGKPIYEELQNAVRRLQDERTWDWFVAGEIQPHSTGSGIPALLASRVMSSVYSHTPAHKLQQHIKMDSIVASVRTAADSLLKGNIRLARSGKSSADTAVLKSGVAELGLLRPGPQDGAYDTFQVTPPNTQANSMGVWGRFERLSSETTWMKLVDELHAPPYGVYNSLLLLFSACFFGLHADEIEVLQNRARQPISVDLLVKMVESPTTYQVRLAPLRESERRFLQNLVPEALKKPFDPNADRGTPLRMRVAAILKDWLAARKLPKFAARLSAEDLRRFLPDEADTTITALALLLAKQVDTTELTGMLLDELPTALGAPADHARWDEPLAQELVGHFAAAARAMVVLPDVLETYAASEAAAVFGAGDVDLERAWSAIYSWRRRRAVDSKLLSSNTGVLFRALNNPSGTVKQALLVEFPSQIIPTIGDYHGWPSFDKLAKLVEALQKAFNEIENLWNKTASQQTVWLTGLARAASGRMTTEDQPERVAKLLAEWSTEQRWPACAAGLGTRDLAAIAPDLDDQQRADILQIVRRASHSADQWQTDVLDTLPGLFGVKGWQQSVDNNIQRVRVALSAAAALDSRLRQHARERITDLFAHSAHGTGTDTSPIRAWRAAIHIPVENDLSETARTLLSLIDEHPDDETLTLNALPRALPEINQPYDRWSSLVLLDQYAACVKQAITEIESYRPLTTAQETWLRGLVTRGLTRPLQNPSREQGRLVTQVAVELRKWLDDVKLPAFAANLGIDDLRALDAGAEPWALAGAQVVLAQHGQEADTLLLETLPAALGVLTPSAEWTADDAATLLERFAAVREMISDLTIALVNHLCSELAPIFGGNGYAVNPSAVARKMREWRSEFVLTPSTQLSPDARVLADAIQTPDSPDELLLARLPRRLGGVGAPFTGWSTWDLRSKYQKALASAADEIARKGQIGEASATARALWNDVRSRLAPLDADDRRWLLKMLQDELNA
ncbi:MAG TPA: hypothetical protein VFS21_25155 [Roseiflexaceae bacterium]|nr:hypothetical protein [Roseiflexaceae bacterium]